MEFKFREIQFHSELPYLPLEGKSAFVVDNCYDPYTRNLNLKYINDNNINCIISQDYDLSYLSECPQVEYVRCSCESVHAETLYGLKNLRALYFPCNDETFDFTKLSDKIEYLSTEIQCKNKSWFKLSDLKYLHLSDYEQEDLRWLDQVAFQESLQSFQISMSLKKFSNLNGIENLISLERFGLDYCRKMKDYGALYFLLGLKEIRLFDVTGTENIDFERFSRLKILYLMDTEGNRQKSIPSIRFMNNMPNLEVCHINYNISDGDLLPLMMLKYVDIYQDRRHYSLKNKNLPK